jgi:tetratricopeptide (TPR) repeat protein
VRHAWVVAPSRRTPSAFVVDCHRNHGGPYTGTTALLRAIVPGAFAAAPDLTLGHALTLLSIAPELRPLLPVGALLSRQLSLSREGNSRLYTARLAQGVADFLLATLVQEASSRSTVCFENVQAADPLDRELIGILLVRADPRRLRITVCTRTEEMDEPLHSALRAHASVRLAARTDSGAADEADRRVTAVSPARLRALARRYVESDCTSDDPRARSAYDLSGAELRGRLHASRLSRLFAAVRAPGAAPSSSLALGAIPFHSERATTPDVEPLVQAAAQCMRMGYYEASLDLSRRGTRLIGGAVRHRAFGELGRNIVFSLLMLGRLEEAEAYCREIESVTDEAALRSHCAYAMAILNARFRPPERRDYDAARAWIGKAIALTESLPDSEAKAARLAFLNNPLALVEMRTGHDEEALRLLSDGLRRLARDAPSTYETESVILLRNRARIHAAMGRPERALDDYRRPAEPRADEQRGPSGSRRAPPAARPCAAKRSRTTTPPPLWSPPYAQAYFNRSLVLRALGREDDALLGPRARPDPRASDTRRPSSIARASSTSGGTTRPRGTDVECVLTDDARNACTEAGEQAGCVPPCSGRTTQSYRPRAS